MLLELNDLSHVEYELRLWQLSGTHLTLTFVVFQKGAVS